MGVDIFQHFPLNGHFLTGPRVQHVPRPLFADFPLQLLGKNIHIGGAVPGNHPLDVRILQGVQEAVGSSAAVADQPQPVRIQHSSRGQEPRFDFPDDFGHILLFPAVGVPWKLVQLRKVEEILPHAVHG